MHVISLALKMRKPFDQKFHLILVKANRDLVEGLFSLTFCSTVRLILPGKNTFDSGHFFAKAFVFKDTIFHLSRDYLGDVIGGITSKQEDDTIRKKSNRRPYNRF